MQNKQPQPSFLADLRFALLAFAAVYFITVGALTTGIRALTAVNDHLKHRQSESRRLQIHTPATD